MNKQLNLPSDTYFHNVQIYEDLVRFIGTGMAFEFEPNCPTYWGKHLELKAEWEKLKNGA